MGIENERKLLLDVRQADQLFKDLKKAVPEHGVEFFDITQGYLTGAGRIRHAVPHVPSVNVREAFYFTFKTKVQGATVELEQEISTHDYQKLFLIVKPWLIKTRAKIVQGSFTWDIDFFKTPKQGMVYLAIAEVEMPEFETQTPEIHPLLEPYAVRWIDFGDKRFNNKNLAHMKKVKTMLSQMESSTDGTKTK
jgi:CYTH domain-containing protein